MKRKFIMITAAVLLILSVFAIGAPGMSPDIDAGVAAVATGPADLTPLGSEADLSIDSNALPVSATATERIPWTALFAIILATLAISYLTQLAINLRYKLALEGRGGTEGALDRGGAETKFIWSTC